MLSAERRQNRAAEYRAAATTRQGVVSTVLATSDGGNYHGSRVDGLDSRTCPRTVGLDDFTILLLVLAVVLAIVTVVGHGIWVLLATIFRGRSKSSSISTSNARGDGFRACPRCYTPLKPHQQDCDVCNWPYKAEQSMDGTAALRVLRRQVEALVQRGALDADARTLLFAAIAEQQQRIDQQVADVPLEPIVTPHVPSVAADVSLDAVPSEPAGSMPSVSEMRAPAAPLAERARSYAASRGAALREEVAASVTPVEPPKKREALSRLFAAFMEEKNIRWGELVGGLLIVGCSIALVISLWSRIASQPLLKFALFNGVTAALFGVGFYTDRRWKIHTTSHGILVIAALLVPLNFLAIAAFTQASPPTDILSLAGEGVSLLGFAALVFFAGRILVPGDAPLLVVGVMVPSLMQLLIRRFAVPASSLATLYSLAAPSVAAYLGTVVAAMHRRWRVAANETADGESKSAADLPELEANRVLIFLGLVSAATIMPLALLLHNVPPVQATLHWLSPLGTVCGLPALVVGLLFWRRISDRAKAGLQTAGIAVGAAGALVMVSSIVFAWPDPATLLPTAISTAVVLTAVALWFGIPAAHVPAGVAIAVASLVGFYVLRGDVAWTLPDSALMRKALLSATTGHALVPLVALFGGIAWLFRRIGRREDSFMYALVVAATAAVSLVLVMGYGFARVGDPQNAVWTLAIYTIAALATAVALERADAARIGSALLLATLVQAIVYRFNLQWQIEQPWIVALLAHGTIIALGCLVFSSVAGTLRVPSADSAERKFDVFGSLAFSALVTSAAAAIWILAASWFTSAGALALYLAWLAGVWLLIAVLTKFAAIFTAAQAAAVFAILCGVTAAVEARAWYVESPRPWLHPWFLEAQGIALAAYCFVLSCLRWAFGRWSRRDGEQGGSSTQSNWANVGARLLDPPWPTVDHIESLAVVFVMALIAVYAVMPGVAQELSPVAAIGSHAAAPIEQFEIAGVPHVHAFDRGGWMLLAAVAISSTAGLWKRRADWRRIELAFAAMAMCLLLAARWEPQVAVASALRWLSAGMFAALSLAVWLMSRSKSAAETYDVTSFAIKPSAKEHAFRDVWVAFIAIVYVAMGAFVCQTSLMQATVSANVQDWWPWVGVWALLAGVVAIALPYAVALQQRDLSNTSKDTGIGSVPTWAVHGRWLLLFLAAAPAAILFTFAVAKALDARPIVGPDQASWFHSIGHAASYGIPLVVVALTFVGYAIRDRAPSFAFAAGLLFNVVTTLVVLIRLAHAGTLDAAAWIQVAQINALVAGIVALVWQGSLVGRPKPLHVVTQVALSVALCCTFLIPAMTNVGLVTPPSSWAASADGVLGWITIAVVAAAALWLQWPKPVSQNAVSVFAAALFGLTTLTAARFDPAGWSAYHTLIAGYVVAAWVVPLATRAINRCMAKTDLALPEMRWSARILRLFTAFAVVLALKGLPSDPAAPWWTVGALIAISARNVWIGWRETGRSSIWIAAILFNVAVSILWLDQRAALSSTSGFGELCEFLWINVLAAAAMAIVSVWIEWLWRANESSPATRDAVSPAIRRSFGVAFHRFAAWAIVAVLLLTTGAGLLADLNHDSFAANYGIGWVAWLAAVVVACACLWDADVRWPVACLYCVGLVAVGMYLDGLDLHAPMFHWALANALAAYSLATSALWSARQQLQSLLARLGMPTAQSSGHAWLVTANLLIGVAVLLLVFWIEVSMPSFTQRMVAAYAIGAQAFAIGLLARGTVRTSLQYTSLVWGVLFSIAFAWAWLSPDFAAVWLHRLIVTVAALAAVVVVYGFGLVKFLRRENEWMRAAARLMPPLALLAGALILVVLGMEVFAYAQTGNVPIAAFAHFVVAFALSGLAVAALVAAIDPGRDPLGLSERGRTVYVYAAEALAGLLFLHIRVTMPWLFQGWFMRFWPLVVLAIAFIGVGFGELFQRRRQRVLAEPLEVTGALLPLLPALGFWVMSSEVHYSLLLLSVGVLYAALSALRSSLLYGVLAAVAANGGLWYFLHEREGLDWTEHPQLWLIPPALCALAAGFINRERLTAQQSAALRYASAIVIYVSSTADIFINGVADAPWLPAVLAGLSIVGVLAGIMLRVRAFLYLGTAFLIVALMTIIWHAAIEEQRTWILWLAGMLTGAIIFAMFGLFEKRRDDVLRVVEELKHWDA